MTAEPTTVKRRRTAKEDAIEAIEAQAEANEDAALPVSEAEGKAKVTKNPVAEKPVKVVCRGIQKDGTPCKMPVLKGTDHCFNHAPKEYREAHSAPAVRGPRWLAGTYGQVSVQLRGKEQLMTVTFSVEDGVRRLALS